MTPQGRPSRDAVTFDLVVVEEPIDHAAVWRAWEAAHDLVERKRLAQRHALHEAEMAFYSAWRWKNPRPAKWKPALFVGR